MRRVFLLLFCFIIIFSYTNVFANIMCNDGTISPSCGDCHRGCCSHHGGCASGGSSYRSGSSNNYRNYSYTRSYVYGCTNINVINYNSNANRDDGSCILKVYGCTDENALNYNSSANVDDGSCIAKVLGCMDKNAKNYNKKANISNGKCLYTSTNRVIKKIKYKTVYKFSLFKNGKVYKKGKNGKKEIIYKITKNEQNVIISNVLVSKKTIVKKVDKVIYTNNIRKIG